MIKNLIIIFNLFFSLNIFAYDYQYKSDNSSIYLKFDGDSIEEIKFKFINNNQKNFGLINYGKDQININLNTNKISFDDFKKFLPKPQKNENLDKKINFNWEIDEIAISDSYSLFSNKLNFIYDKGFESMMFYDSKKEFELSILPRDSGVKQLYLYSKNAGQFFYAQKITKSVIGGALIGKGTFRRFDDYDLNIKVKDFSINKEAKFYNLIFTSRLLDIFSILQNNQDEFNYLEVPLFKKGDLFTFDHAIMLGGTVAFSFKGDANPKKKQQKLTELTDLYIFLKKIFRMFPF